MLGGDAALRVAHRDISRDERAWLERRADVSRIVYLRSMARAGTRRSLIEMKMVDGAYPLYGALETRPALDADGPFAKRDGAWGAVVDPALLRRLGIEIGDTLEVGGAVYRIAAEIDREPDRVSGARPLQLGPRFIASSESLDETALIRPGSQVWYFYRVRLEDPGGLDAWKEDLERAFPDGQWIVRDRTNASPTIKRFIDRTTLFMTLVGLTALLVGGVGVGNAVRDFLAGKMQTIATLKCVGAASRTIFAAYLVQVLAMGGAGGGARPPGGRVGAGPSGGLAARRLAGRRAGRRLRTASGTCRRLRFPRLARLRRLADRQGVRTAGRGAVSRCRRERPRPPAVALCRGDRRALDGARGARGLDRRESRHRSVVRGGRRGGYGPVRLRRRARQAGGRARGADRRSRTAPFACQSSSSGRADRQRRAVARPRTDGSRGGDARRDESGQPDHPKPACARAGLFLRRHPDGSVARVRERRQEQTKGFAPSAARRCCGGG